ncbi:heat-shock protein [Methylopila jiangsuensis]|uniref:Heat-shock protein n=1 Tax=Methylopila jiangsuensis TaxID=586230 RepID=A0A9W6N3E5_9HYPH|nr:Hsp70 family protein [Methylopila jiangsuensis]MDR6286712.1 putative chaperone protein [Methylopila jiangsuensis]GLK76944.1 heat-shock protein [Methylopila jiangsuensis]
MTACGLDFGTSNTTLGLAGQGLARLEDDEATLPSAIFFPPTASALVGRAALKAYRDGEPGRLMRSLKSALGTSLIEETTQIGRERVKFRDVIGRYVGVVRRRAEQATGAELDAVVHGRPVHFVDGDPAGDARAEDTLREIAHSVGFREISFQYEPVAAALDYERTIGAEELALIADIGGGTSDFSVVRLSPERHRAADRSADILANDGVRIGGVDFDRRLSLGVAMPLLGFRSPMKRAGLEAPSSWFHDLATWQSINKLYDGKAVRSIRETRRESAAPELLDRLIRVIEAEAGHGLAADVEAAKIGLSDAALATVPLGIAERGLFAEVAPDDLVRHTRELAARIAARIGDCLLKAGVSAERIDAVFLTGGSTRLAHVRAAILAAVPGARVAEGDTFGSVGSGLALEAARRYG